MLLNDIINGVIEFVGGILCWMNFFRLLRDKQVRGVCWGATMFFATWAFWSLPYYASLDQWLSCAGAVFLVTGNWAWVILAIKYRKN